MTTLDVSALSSLGASFNQELSEILDGLEKPSPVAQSSYDPYAERCQLTYWGLPSRVVQSYHAVGIRSLYPWQAACLATPGFLSGELNFVVSAPTSAGKTQVVEIAWVNRWKLSSKTVLYVVPFISIVEEKARYFSRLFSSLGIRVRGLHSSKGSTSTVTDDLVVCTIEKASNMVNRYIADGKLSDIGMIVVDELHVLMSSDRGAILEGMLCKVLCMRPRVHVQIVGMSATLPESDSLCSWLNAYMFVTDFRPIRLTERVCIGSCSYSLTNGRLSSPELLRCCDGSPASMVHYWCRLTMAENASCIVFCPSKQRCEDVAVELAADLFATDDGPVTDDIENVLNQLAVSPSGADELLSRCVRSRVAYHHGGLTVEERSIIEEGFRRSVIRVLCATTTVAAGVNLPARRVVFSSLRFGSRALDVLQYRQAAGRAGRAGFDAEGESVLLVSEDPGSKRVLDMLLAQSLPKFVSNVGPNSQGLFRLLLDCVCLNIANTKDQLLHVLKRCLWCVVADSGSLDSTSVLVSSTLSAAVHYLTGNAMVAPDPGCCDFEVFHATQLGRACCFSGMFPDDALLVYRDLASSRRALSLESDAHLLFICTPLRHGIEPPWASGKFRSILRQCSAEIVRIAQVVDVDDSFLVHCEHRPPSSDARNEVTVRHKRFYAALILTDLLDERPLCELSAKYCVPRGAIQSLQHVCGTFAGIVSAFLEQLGWWSLSALCGLMHDRCQYCVRPDILEIAQLSCINTKEARALFNAGYRSITDIARAEVRQLEMILSKMLRFQTVDRFRNEACDADGCRRIAHSLKTSAVTYVKGKLKEAVDAAQLFVDEDECAEEELARPAESDAHSDILAESVPQPLLSTLTGEGQLSKVRLVVLPASCERLEEWSRKSRYAIVLDWSSAKSGLFGKCLQPCLHSLTVVWKCSHGMYEGFSVGFSASTMSIIGEILSSPHSGKVCIFGKEIGTCLAAYGLSIKGPVVDVSVLQWLIGNSVSDGKTTAEFRANDAVGHARRSTAIEYPASQLPLECDRKRMEDQALLAVQLLTMSEELIARLHDSGLDEHFRRIDMPIIPVVVHMQHCGLPFDLERARQLYSHVTAYLEWIGKQTKRLLGRKLDFDNNTDCCKALFHELNISSSEFLGYVIPAKGRNGKLRINVAVLEKLYPIHPVPQYILHHRRLVRMRDQFLQPCIDCCVYDDVNHSDRIFADVNSCGTSTGRFSMTSPNLMCSPHAIEIDRLWARGQGLLHHELSFRDCIAAADGFCLLSVDYAQLEMRILAHFSRDAALTAIFSDSKQDLFKSVAAELNGTDPSKVDSVDRNIAKRLCYAIVYGMTSHTLAAELEVEEHEAASYIRTFMAKFPGVADFIERAHDEGATRGFVTTLLGSRRYLSESESSSKAQVQKLYRKAVNSICQGSAADVIRTAMVRIFEAMQSSIHTHCEQWKESALDRTRRPPLPPVRLVLQIHDELLFEVRQDKLPLLKHVVVESMQLAIPLSVPLQVKIKVGTRWGSLRETPYP